MGTRGTYGFYREEDKLTYNHFDSYPKGLGSDIVKFIVGLGENKVAILNEIYDRIVLVTDKDPITDEVREQVKNYLISMNIPEKAIKEHITENAWYELLRLFQGELEPYIHGLVYMEDHREFIKDSLFCEWGYIINLNNNVLEVYQGFQKSPSPSRYGEEKDGDYYPSRLIKELPLDNIQEEWEKFLSTQENE